MGVSGLVSLGSRAAGQFVELAGREPLRRTGSIVQAGVGIAGAPQAPWPSVVAVTSSRMRLVYREIGDADD